jgi:hypothetical protein
VATLIAPTVAPAAGPDGSLYFVNGMEVYGVNADLQELWKVTLAEKLTSIGFHIKLTISC